MRKIFVFLVAVTTLVTIGFLSVRFASAEDTSGTKTPKPTTKGQLIRQEVKDKIQEKGDDKEAKFCELRKGLIRSYFKRMLGRFSALADRLQKLIDRIQSRIDKIEAGGNGTDLVGPKSDLGEAKTKLADAKLKLDSLKTDISTFLVCENPKGDFKDIKDKVQEIKKDLKEVHRLLVHIIGNIKGLRIGETEKSPEPTAAP